MYYLSDEIQGDTLFAAMLKNDLICKKCNQPKALLADFSRPPVVHRNHDAEKTVSVVTHPVKRHPRYMPPESDFWKVYNQTEGQDGSCC